MGKIKWVLASLTLALLLMAAMFAGPITTDAQSGMTNFTSLSASRDVFVGRDVVVDGLVSEAPSAATSVITGTILTPTHNVHIVHSAATMTLTLGAPDVPMRLTLINTGTQTVRLLDAGNQKLTGVVNIGADDVLQLYFNGDFWYQVAALVAN